MSSYIRVKQIKLQWNNLNLYLASCAVLFLVEFSMENVLNDAITSHFSRCGGDWCVHGWQFDKWIAREWIARRERTFGHTLYVRNHLNIWFFTMGSLKLIKFLRLFHLSMHINHYMLHAFLIAVLVFASLHFECLLLFVILVALSECVWFRKHFNPKRLPYITTQKKVSSKLALTPFLFSIPVELKRKTIFGHYTSHQWDSVIVVGSNLFEATNYKLFKVRTGNGIQMKSHTVTKKALAWVDSS